MTKCHRLFVSLSVIVYCYFHLYTVNIVYKCIVHLFYVIQYYLYMDTEFIIIILHDIGWVLTVLYYYKLYKTCSMNTMLLISK